jgi:hypothetical protein
VNGGGPGEGGGAAEALGMGFGFHYAVGVIADSTFQFSGIWKSEVPHTAWGRLVIEELC